MLNSGPRPTTYLAVGMACVKISSVISSVKIVMTAPSGTCLNVFIATG